MIYSAVITANNTMLDIHFDLKVILFSKCDLDIHDVPYSYNKNRPNFSKKCDKLNKYSLKMFIKIY